MSTDDTHSSDELMHPSCIGFHREFTEINKIILKYRSGIRQNVAIIGMPYSGRSTFHSALYEIYKEDSYSTEFRSKIESKQKLAEYQYSKPIIFIDGCQYLFSRRIGGFDVLDNFLREIAASSSLFITTWNLYAWNYLKRVRELERFFPAVITLPPLTDTEMRGCILKGYTDAELQFIGGVEVELPSLVTFDTTKLKVPFRNAPLEFPFPRFNLDRFSLRRNGKEEHLSDEEQVFQKITRMADGNPGVGKAIWKKSFVYPTVNLKDYTPIRLSDPFHRKDAFILGVIAMMGNTSMEDLLEAASEEYDITPSLYRLLSSEIIKEVEGGYQVCPEALLEVHQFLFQKRIFWE